MDVAQGIWALVCVMAGQEFKFRDRLLDTQSSIGAYVPQRRQMVRSGHRHRSKTAVFPAFPRYVFAHVPPGYRPYRWMDETRIDYRLITCDGNLALVPEQDVLRVRKMETSGELDALPKDLSLQFKRGNLALITQGAFEGIRVPVVETPQPWSQQIAVRLGGFVARLPLAFFETA